MAVPESRQIVFGSTVVPQETYLVPSTLETAESGAVYGTPAVLKYKADGTAIYKVNGEGRVDIEADQENNGWTSIIGHRVWESLDDTTAFFGHRWNDLFVAWDDEQMFGNTPISLASFVGNVIFLYVKNVGDALAELSLDGGASYPIYIPAGAAVTIHFPSGTFSSSLLYIRAQGVSDVTTVEYVCAQ